MAREDSVTHLLGTIQDDTVYTLKLTDSTTWLDIECPHCGGRQMLVVAAQLDGNYKQSAVLPRWLKCVGCQRAALYERGQIHPAQKPLREPLGLPPIDAAIWEETRACLSVGANAAAVMLCRKLLLHIAVANGLAPKNGKDRAPTFYEAIEHLEQEQVIAKKMRPWVDRIKDVGNDANHELSPISRELAMDVATFTEQLLRLAYEMEALMATPGGTDSEAAAE